MPKKKKKAYAMIEQVLMTSNDEWLPAHEIMARANEKLPGRASVFTRGVAHWLKVLVSRNQVEKRQANKIGLYRWRW